MKRASVLIVLLLATTAGAEIRPTGDVDSAVERGLASIARARRSATRPAGSEAPGALAFLAAGHLPGRGPLGLAMRQSIEAAEREAAVARDVDRPVLAIALIEAASVGDASGGRLLATAATLLRETPDASASAGQLAWYALATRRLTASDPAFKPPFDAAAMLRRRLDPASGLIIGIDGRVDVASTAAALVALDAAGGPADGLVEKGTASLLASVTKGPPPKGVEELMWLAWLAVRLPGESQDALWRLIRPAVLSRQKDDGTFRSEDLNADVTAASVLTLSAVYRALPVMSGR